MKLLFNSVLVFFFIQNSLFGLSLIHIKGEDTLSYIIRDTILENQPYVSSDLLTTLFETSPYIAPKKQKWAIKTPAAPLEKGTLWTFTAENPFVRIHQNLYNLTYPIRKTPQGFFFPLQPLLPHLQKEFPLIEFKPSEQTLWVGTQLYNILNITPSIKKNGAQVTVQFSKSMQYSGLWVPPHYIVNVDKGVLKPQLVADSSHYSKGAVRSIQSIQDEKSAQITIRLRGNIDTIEQTYITQKKQLQLLIRKKKRPPPPTLKAPSKKVRTIIIDPGHGGRDPGALSNRISEKKITLQVAKRLKKKLKKKGFKVLLTRENDKYLTLEERPKFASQNGGDLFLSLHCNAIGGSAKKKRSVKGFVAYILRAGESEEDNSLARRENAAVQKSTKKQDKKELSSVDWILLEHELNLYSHQSEKVAEEIVRAFDGGRIKKYSTGARQAGFFVLVGAFMPAVLFEMGFLTNETDRKYMNSSRGQEDIAKRLAKSVEEYFKKAE